MGFNLSKTILIRLHSTHLSPFPVIPKQKCQHRSDTCARKGTETTERRHGLNHLSPASMPPPPPPHPKKGNKRSILLHSWLFVGQLLPLRIVWTNSIATCTTSTLADVFVDSTGMGVGVGVCGGWGVEGFSIPYQSHLHRFSCLFILVNSYTYIGSYNVPPCLFNMVITEFDVLTSLFVSIRVQCFSRSTTFISYRFFSLVVVVILFLFSLCFCLCGCVLVGEGGGVPGCKARS